MPRNPLLQSKDSPQVCLCSSDSPPCKIKATAQQQIHTAKCYHIDTKTLADTLPLIDNVATEEYSVLLCSSGALSYENFSALLRHLEESRLLAGLSLNFCELPEHEEAWN